MRSTEINGSNGRVSLAPPRENVFAPEIRENARFFENAPKLSQSTSAGSYQIAGKLLGLMAYPTEDAACSAAEIALRDFQPLKNNGSTYVSAIKAKPHWVRDPSTGAKVTGYIPVGKVGKAQFIILTGNQGSELVVFTSELRKKGSPKLEHGEVAFTRNGWQLSLHPLKDPALPYDRQPRGQKSAEAKVERMPVEQN